MTPLSSLSAEAAARDPDGLALVFDGREISFADLHRRVEGVAGELRSHGVSAGTPVGVGTVNTAEAVATLLAVWRLGAIVIDLAPGLSGTDRRSAVERTGAPVLWSSEGLTETGVHAQGPALELACVTFTSGSTGIPKGVMLGEDNLVRNAELYVRHFRLTPADRTCLVLPLSFGMNKIALLAHLSIGAGVLLEPDFMVPNRALGA
ncbi:MAG TPA: AMP-binding protein, partial [Actinomycetota bacterium]|nr:AMP-binding protein [Actinomycetota bacterium]